MSLAPHSIRSRVAAAIEAVTGWSESPTVYDRFPDATRQVAHLGFAVGVPDTTTLAQDRQRPANGVYAFTVVGVRWTHRLRADAQVADYDAACQAELDMVAAVMGMTRNPGLAPRLRSANRSVVADGTYVLGSAIFDVSHTYPLE